jgi:glutamate racemase
MTRRKRPLVGFIDSGLGLVDFADSFHRLLPDADLLLSMDPDWMPYGALEPSVVAERIIASADVFGPWEPDAVVIACNTGSVHGLAALRHVLEPDVPVVGTVPAVKTAADSGVPFAIWATQATTASDYQRGLIDAFAAEAEVHAVPCPGLAEAIDAADLAAVDAAIDVAVAETPDHVEAIVLGCTHYGLVEDRIRARRPGTSALHDSPVAVARQTLRRLGIDPEDPPMTHAEAPAGRVLATYMSGRRAALPDTLEAYPAGVRLHAIEARG